MRTNVLPNEATHSSLDIFEKAPLLITFENSFDQKVGSSYSSDGPSIEFVVVSDRNNFIDLQKIFLEVHCRIKQSDGTDLRHHATDAALRDRPSFVNNTLHSLFSDCNVYANGAKVSSSNGLYGHKSFIETEFSNGDEAKKTWLVCQGYSYEKDPSSATDAAIVARELTTRQSGTVAFIGKIASDFFTCDKHLLSGVTLRISLLRAQNDFVTIAEGGTKHYKVEITQANLYVRKMTVSDNVLSAIENVLIKTPAMYRYNEVIPKTFLASTGVMSWKQEDVFHKEPIRRFAVALSANTAFIGSNVTNPYNYQKFDLKSITVYRNGIPVAGTPLSTADNKRIYFNSLSSLAFVEGGHGIPLADFENHYVMVFDLTSTQQATHDYIHPELTNASITLEMIFGTALAQNTEIFLIGEKLTTVYVDSARNISKNTLMESF